MDAGGYCDGKCGGGGQSEREDAPAAKRIHKLNGHSMTLAGPNRGGSARDREQWVLLLGGWIMWVVTGEEIFGESQKRSQFGIFSASDICC